MSENIEADQAWPTHCSFCGTELETAVVTDMTANENEWAQGRPPLEAIARDFCPNPDCPGKQTAAESPDQAAPTDPGSLGGDNGGA